MREIVILGVGMHKFGRFPEKTYWEMGRVATVNALEDAGVEWKDIQALYAGSMFAGVGVGNNILAEMGFSGIPVVNAEAACSSGPTALSNAYQAVSAGFCDLALAVAVEKQERGMIPLTNFPLWMRLMGMAHGPGFYAQEARVHMERYGTTVEQFAKVSVKSHKNASLCPNAHYQQYGQMTIEDVLNSRMICDPLTIYMMAPVVDGAAAIVVSARDVAHKYSSKPPITVAASVLTSANYDRYTLQEPPGMVRGAAQKAYEFAGIGPEDLDIVECQDAMASAEITSCEELGLCPDGEGGILVDEGRTEIGGDVAVNTDGGYLSRGNATGATGLAGIAEIVWQLRGEAGPRQVANPRVGLNQNFGAGPNVSVTILKK